MDGVAWQVLTDGARGPVLRHDEGHALENEKLKGLGCHSCLHASAGGAMWQMMAHWQAGGSGTGLAHWTITAAHLERHDKHRESA